MKFQMANTFKFMAWDKNGKCYCYNHLPMLGDDMWCMDLNFGIEARIQEMFKYKDMCPGEWNQTLILNHDYLELPDEYEHIIWKRDGTCFIGRGNLYYDLEVQDWIIQGWDNYSPKIKNPTQYSNYIHTEKGELTINLVYRNWEALVETTEDGDELAFVSQFKYTDSFPMYAEFVRCVDEFLIGREVYRQENTI